MHSTMEFVPRPAYRDAIDQGLAESNIVVLQGPRQCGKTSLARQYEVPDSHYFDLDDPLDQIRLEENARSTLANLKGLVVIDEAQKKPELFSILRVLSDRPDNSTRFLLLGSASSLLLKQVSESLAGRAYIIDMSGFSLTEAGTHLWQKLWIKGAFPKSFRKDEIPSMKWRLDYIAQFISRDLRDLGETKISDSQIRKLLMLIASSQGSNWNHSKAAAIIGVNQKTVQRYLELFQATFVVRELPLYSTNTTKRLRKAPKYFLRDSGVTHALLQISNYDELLAKPELGASWEGFALEQVCTALNLSAENQFTWGVQSGAEMDLVFKHDSELYGIEFKHSEAPRSSKSLTSAIESIPLKKAWIVHSGPKTYPINERADAVSIQNLSKIVGEL